VRRLEAHAVGMEAKYGGLEVNEAQRLKPTSATPCDTSGLYVVFQNWLKSSLKLPGRTWALGERPVQHTSGSLWGGFYSYGSVLESSEGLSGAPRPCSD